jgi:methionyl-tRNA formyltransferase
MSFRVIFLGTPDIAVPCLDKLVSIREIEVVGVITQPDRPAGRSMQLQMSPVKKAALSHGLPVISPEKVRTPEVLEWIRKLNPDSSVVIAFGQILSKEFLSLFPKQSVNLHASLLPKWRGAAPIQRSLMNEDKKTGVSLQVIVPKLDAGPLLGLREITIDENMNAFDLYSKVKVTAPELLSQEYLEYLRGTKSPVEQDESAVTIANKISKQEGLINWELSSGEIRNRIRGLWMWPGSWTLRAGKTLKIWATNAMGEHGGKPGVIIKSDTQSVTVSCGKGSLQILEVQPESRAKMAASEYLKGYPVEIGEKLGT